MSNEQQLFRRQPGSLQPAALYLRKHEKIAGTLPYAQRIAYNRSVVRVVKRLRYEDSRTIPV